MPSSHSVLSLARSIGLHPEKRRQLFLEQPEDIQAQVLPHLNPTTLSDLISKIPVSQVAHILEHLDPDQATLVLRSAPNGKRKKIINAFEDGLQTSVTLLTAFDPQTAAGIMSLSYIQVEDSESIKNVAKRFRIHEQNSGRAPAVIVMKNNEPIGFLPWSALGYAGPGEVIHSHVRRLISVDHNADHKKVLHLFREHPHSAVAVLGDHKQVLGVIYSDDVLRLLDRQASSALYDFAGVHDEERVTDGVAIKVKSRYTWLLVNLGTAFLAASVVNLFQETINTYVLLAVYMPVVAGMGGNASTQTLAIIVRGIAFKQISLVDAWPVIKREVGAGAINGLITGAVVAIAVMLFSQDVAIAGILAVAMVINLCVAGFFGTLIPLVLQKLGKDPATSASIFITTATDIFGFLVFLGLASLILP